MDNRKTGLSIIHGYIKAQAFSVYNSFFLELGLIGYEHAKTHDFSQDES